MKKWIILLLLCVLLAGCAQAGPATTAPEEQELKEDFLRQVRQDYLDTSQFPNCSCQLEDVNLIIVSRVESGCALFIGCKCDSFRTDKAWLELVGESAADLTFYMPNGWFLMFYRNGEFTPMASAYNSQWLSYGELRTIWDEYYAQYPEALERWKSVNPGLSQPPQRDPSGLDYEVNADAKTCTVTGPGVFVGKELVIPEYIDGYQVTAIGELAFWPRRITSLVMPDSITSIGQSAFEDCHELQTVKLSANLEKLGSRAFANCTNLQALELPDSVTAIGGGAFAGCEKLTAFRVPAGVTVLEAGTFSGCKGLTQLNIHDRVTAIGFQAFSGCTGLTQLHLPESLTALGEGAFTSCTALTSMVIPQGVTKIESGLFSYCLALESVTLPNTVTEIGWRAFADCKSLAAMVLPDSVTVLGDYAFEGCQALKSLTIGPNLVDISIDNCKTWYGLAEIMVSENNPQYHVSGNCLIETETKTLMLACANAQIPADGSVKIIGQCAFYGKTDLEQVVIPEGVERISKDAFEGCVNLQRITIPKSMVAIGVAFYGCDRLTDVDYAGTVKQWNAIRTDRFIRGSEVYITVHCTDGKIEDMR